MLALFILTELYQRLAPTPQRGCKGKECDL
jgi:hypothetical protein